MLLNFFKKALNTSGEKSAHPGWSGDYPGWEAARKMAAGYDAQETTHQIREALLKVQRGEAAYARDACLFDRIHYSWPLLSGLMFAAARSQGQLNLLDFGGSLGASYFQNRVFLDRIAELSWSIVEHPNTVAIGKKEFQSDRLRFFPDIPSCIEDKNPNTLLVSGALQYLADPYVRLTELLRVGFAYLVFDRTQFNRAGRDRISLQTAPFYQAGFPCWSLDEAKFLRLLKEHAYTEMASFSSFCDADTDHCYFKGFIFVKACGQEGK